MLTGNSVVDREEREDKGDIEAEVPATVYYVCLNCVPMPYDRLNTEKMIYACLCEE